MTGDGPLPSPSRCDGCIVWATFSQLMFSCGRRSLVELVEQDATHDEAAAAGEESDTLSSRLRACLELHTTFRDTVRSLRDVLGPHVGMSRTTSVSSVNAAMGAAAALKKATSKEGKPGTKSPTKRAPGGGSDGSTDTRGNGVAVSDEDTMMAHMDTFCMRIRQVVDVVQTMSQFKRMTTALAGLPRPRQEDLVADSLTDKPDAPTQPATAAAQQPLATGKPDKTLEAITEDDDEVLGEGAGEAPTAVAAATSDSDIVNTSNGLTRSDLALLRRYYPAACGEDDGPTVRDVVEQHCETMIGTAQRVTLGEMWAAVC